MIVLSITGGRRTQVVEYGGDRSLEGLQQFVETGGVLGKAEEDAEHKDEDEEELGLTGEVAGVCVDFAATQDRSRVPCSTVAATATVAAA